MPWKGEADPYKIWLSEVILQQTRVEQGQPYYERFIMHYPTISRLAAAPDPEVFKLWEGLGYYSRCRNLLATARLIAFERKGIFPADYHEILALKGVGPYTAAAIASFAYGHPHAVADGNVFRVLARFFGIETAVNTPAGKNEFQALADSVLDRNEPARYNQAIMDFGATICTPSSPLCQLCPLNTKCVAFKTGRINKLPVKLPKPLKKQRFFLWIFAEHEGKFYVRERQARDVWRNLNEFISFEYSSAGSLLKAATAKGLQEAVHQDAKILSHSGMIKQELTHQSVHAVIIGTKLKKAFADESYRRVYKNELLSLPFPRIPANFLGQWKFRFESGK